MSTIITTDRTIEVSAIDEDYMMPIRTNVQSVVFIPGTGLKAADYVTIIENSVHATNPVKIVLSNLVNGHEVRTWVFNQRLQLGFVLADCSIDAWCKVIFNIGELHYNRRTTNIRISAWNTQMKMKLSVEDVVL